MEKRKIVKLGNSSYVVTLPIEWIIKNKLKKGDELNLIENNPGLFIIPQSKSQGEREVILNYEKPFKFFIKKVFSAYFKNYKTIIIKGNNLTSEIGYIKQIVNKLNTLQIYEVNDDRVVLKDLTDISSLDVEELINLIVKSIKTIFSEISKKEINFTLIKELDIEINKLTYLVFKSINSNLKNNYNQKLTINTIQYWRIVSSLEGIADILKRIARYLNTESENNVPELKILFSRTREYFVSITSVIYSNDLKKQKELSNYTDFKHSILKDIEMSRDQFKESINLFLVITQLLKDILGKIDLVVVSIIDME